MISASSPPTSISGLHSPQDKKDSIKEEALMSPIQRVSVLSEKYNVAEIVLKALFFLNNTSINQSNSAASIESYRNDKKFIFQLESDIIDFIGVSNTHSWKLHPLNSYYRLLTHKVCEYYELGHILSNDGYSMVIFKSNTSLINSNDYSKKMANMDDKTGNIKPLKHEEVKFDANSKLNRIRLVDLFEKEKDAFDIDGKIESIQKAVAAATSPRLITNNSAEMATPPLSQNSQSSELQSKPVEMKKPVKIMKREDPGSVSSTNSTVPSSLTEEKLTAVSPLTEVINKEESIYQAEKDKVSDKLLRAEKYKLARGQISDDDDDDDEEEEDDDETPNFRRNNNYNTNSRHKRNNGNYTNPNYYTPNMNMNPMVMNMNTMGVPHMNMPPMNMQPMNMGMISQEVPMMIPMYHHPQQQPPPPIPHMSPNPNMHMMYPYQQGQEPNNNSPRQQKPNYGGNLKMSSNGYNNSPKNYVYNGNITGNGNDNKYKFENAGTKKVSNYGNNNNNINGNRNGNGFYKNQNQNQGQNYGYKSYRRNSLGITHDGSNGDYGKGNGSFTQSTNANTANNKIDIDKIVKGIQKLNS